MARPVWEVVGGSESGGILVRSGQSIKSEAESTRLAHGAVVEEVHKIGDRLRYKLKSGSGPIEGWISVKASGKELAVPTRAEVDDLHTDSGRAALDQPSARGSPEDATGPLAAWNAMRDKLFASPAAVSTIKEAKPWIVPAKPGTSPPARARLVIFDWTGNRGGAGSFHGGDVRSNWQRWLSESATSSHFWEVCKVELPGRGMRPKEANATSAEEVAAAVADALGRIGPPAAQVFFGVSFGSIIAYETAALLTDRGQPPLGLVTVSAEHPRWGGRGRGAGESYGPTKNMSDTAFETMLRDKKGTDMVLGMPGEMKTRALAAIRADMQMEELYAQNAAEPVRLPFPIVAFRGKECPQVAREDVDPWLQCTALGAGSPSRIVELESELHPTPEQHWLSDWYLCQGEASAKAMLKTVAQEFGSAER